VGLDAIADFGGCPQGRSGHKKENGKVHSRYSMTNCETGMVVESTDEVEWPREPKQGVFQGIGVRHVHWELLGVKALFSLVVKNIF